MSLIEGTVATTTVKLKITCRHCDGKGSIKQSEHVWEPCWSCDGLRTEEAEFHLVDFLEAAGVVFHSGRPDDDQQFPPEHLTAW